MDVGAKLVLDVTEEEDRGILTDPADDVRGLTDARHSARVHCLQGNLIYEEKDDKETGGARSKGGKIHKVSESSI